MTEPVVRRRTPWLATALLLIIAIALGVTAGVLYSNRKKPASFGLTATETSAVTAARQVVVNLFTFRYGDNFDADFQRAVDGTTGTLQSQFKATQSALKATLNNGKINTTCQVTAAGFEQLSGTSVLALVVANTYSVNTKGVSTETNHPRFEITMTLVNGHWLGTNLSAVELA